MQRAAYSAGPASIGGALARLRLCAPIAFVLLLSLVSVGCSDASDEAASTDGVTRSDPFAEAESTLEKRTVVGPVEAVVRVAPDEPVLGDRIAFELEVTAEAGVDVTMPAFGAQLGRFGIVDYVPRRRVDPTSGATIHSQRYTLDLPMSGRQRIPSLLVEFVDNREEAPSGVGEPRELLTEEIPLDVESPTPGDVSEELRPPLGPLPELETAGEWHESPSWWLVAGAVATGVLAIVVVVWLVRRGRPEPTVDPYAQAMSRLRALERGGVPSSDSPEEADAWWVELSSVVRRYIESFYGLRAPELTTEEFLRLARESDRLQPEHRDMLARLLAQADRVKFADYAPQEDESRDALMVARRFVEESHQKSTREPERA